VAKTLRDKGYPYRWVTHNGEEVIIDPESTKLSLWDDHQIVYIGVGSVTVAGETFDGYTNDPVIVQEFGEMFAESVIG